MDKDMARRGDGEVERWVDRRNTLAGALVLGLKGEPRRHRARRVKMLGSRQRPEGRRKSLRHGNIERDHLDLS
jgi:hypothetical protein